MTVADRKHMAMMRILTARRAMLGRKKWVDL